MVDTMTLEELRDQVWMTMPMADFDAAFDAAIRERDELRGTRESKEKAAMRAGCAPDPANTRTLDELLRDSDILRRRGIVEIAEVNASVADYCRHWEQRAKKAEAELAAMKARIAVAPIIHAEKTWRGTLFMNLSQHDVDLLDGKRVRLVVEE